MNNSLGGKESHAETHNVHTAPHTVHTAPHTVHTAPHTVHTAPPTTLSKAAHSTISKAAHTAYKVSKQIAYDIAIGVFVLLLVILIIVLFSVSFQKSLTKNNLTINENLTVAGSTTIAKNLTVSGTFTAQTYSSNTNLETITVDGITIDGTATSSSTPSVNLTCTGADVLSVNDSSSSIGTATVQCGGVSCGAIVTGNITSTDGITMGTSPNTVSLTGGSNTLIVGSTGVIKCGTITMTNTSDSSDTATISCTGDNTIGTTSTINCASIGIGSGGIVGLSCSTSGILEVGGNITADGYITCDDITCDDITCDTITASGDISTSASLYCTGNASLGGGYINGQLDLTGPLCMAYDGSSGNNVVLYDSGYLYLDTVAAESSVSIYATSGINCSSIGLLGAGKVSLSSPSTGVLNVGGTVESNGVALTSDYRLKEEIEPISDEYSIDKLNPCSYVLKDDESKKLQTGFIAHELQEIFPHLVNGEKDGERMQSVNYMGLIAILTKELQNLKSDNIELKADITMLKAKLC